jgi:hypothetical protein
VAAFRRSSSSAAFVSLARMCFLDCMPLPPESEP